MNRISPIHSIFLALILLAACVQSQKPAPVTLYGASQGEGSAGVHTVVGKETLWDVSQRYQLAMRDIAAANNMTAPFDLTPGQRLRLPPPREYRVRATDSLYTVSRLFAVNTSDIAQLNHILPPYTLKEGQTLRLPTLTRNTQPVPSIMTLPQPARAVAQAPSRNAPVQSQTQNIARNNAPQNNPYNNNVYNNATSPSVSPGQVLTAPLGQQVAANNVEAAVEKPQPLEVVEAPEEPVKKTPITAQVPKRASSKFLKPVSGKVIAGYGPKSDGLYNDGINIQAARGAVVKAAENGVVVYAGDELKASGNLVIIRHQDRWMTAYAHMDKLLIKRGDVVKRGQTIGTVGSTGSVDSPQLHFEVRRGTEALNPTQYLES